MRKNLTNNDMPEGNERERNISYHLISFKAYGVRSLSSLLHGVNAADHPDLKGCSNVLVLSSREKSS